MTEGLEGYHLWTTHPYFDEQTRAELAGIRDDPAEIAERFGQSLQFGTGGLRSLIGAGTNRINRYTVRQISCGLARYIASCGESARQRGVVIAYDSRRHSPEFALEAALTLNASGISAYMWESLRPAPMLSFAVRELGTIAGVVITASHNPPAYNGYKVYWEDGGQVHPQRAAAIEGMIPAGGVIPTIHPMPVAQARDVGLLRAVPEAVDNHYLARLQTLVATTPVQRAACHILYSPLHGSGNFPVRRVLAEAGYRVSVVREQECPDASFPTVRTPNPEDPAVFALALQQTGTDRPDVIMATDPDADRLGVVARDRRARYRPLSGNQIGAVLLDYLLSRRSELGTLPASAVVVKTIATSNIAVPLCRQHGVALINTHTGFKYIGEKIEEFGVTGSHSFLFGFEESHGYLAATFVRDKDAVMSALLVAEATAYHKAAGRTLWDALARIWKLCGHFCEDQHTLTLPGRQGRERIAAMLGRLRRTPPQALGGVPVACIDDYATGEGFNCATGAAYPLALARADVIHYHLAGGGFVVARPSGTEPKLKVYFSLVGESASGARRRLLAVKADLLQLLSPPQAG